MLACLIFNFLVVMRRRRVLINLAGWGTGVPGHRSCRTYRLRDDLTHPMRASTGKSTCPHRRRMMTVMDAELKRWLDSGEYFDYLGFGIFYRVGGSGPPLLL